MSYHYAKFGHSHSGRGFNSDFSLSPDFARRVIKRSCNLMGGSPTWQVNTLPSLVTTGIVALEMFLVVEEQDSTCPRFNPPLPLISKAHSIPYSQTHEISGRRH